MATQKRCKLLQLFTLFLRNEMTLSLIDSGLLCLIMAVFWEFCPKSI